MRRLLFVALVLSSAAGCNWSDLDAEFLAALPQKGDLRVTPPSQQQKQALSSDGDLGSQQSAISTAAADIDRNAANLNQFVEALTSGLDAVRVIQPTVRETDRRVWGPYADKDHPGCDSQVEVKRGDAGFEYSVQWRVHSPEGEFVPVLRGSFAGDHAADGSGQFVLDATASRTLSCFPGCDPAPAECDNSMTLAYQHSPDLEVRVLRSTTTAEYSYRHARLSDGSREMNYSVLQVVNNLTTSIQADAKWLPNRAGHLRVLTSLPAWWFAWHYEECWDTTLEQVYWSKDYVDEQSEPLCAVRGANGLCEGGQRTSCTPALP
jgi:hypothetical protein